MQGSVVDSSAEVLLNRLRGIANKVTYMRDKYLSSALGLCDAPETKADTFHDHEMCFCLSITQTL